MYLNSKNKKKLSFDTNDFDVSFMRGLNLEDGVTTLTDFTASIIGEELSLILKRLKIDIDEVLICGGGRKNKVLIKKIKENLRHDISLKPIDEVYLQEDQEELFMCEEGFCGLWLL